MNRPMRMAASVFAMLILSGCMAWDWREMGRDLLTQLCLSESSVTCDEEREARRRY